METERGQGRQGRAAERPKQKKREDVRGRETPNIYPFCCACRTLHGACVALQAASLLGLGLLYQGSCHRLMTETMLEEIGRTPGVNPSLANAAAGAADTAGGSGVGSSLASLMCVTHDREGYALAAGCALGLICLGQGHNAPGLADLHLVDKLRCARRHERGAERVS